MSSKPSSIDHWDPPATPDDHSPPATPDDNSWPATGAEGRRSTATDRVVWIDAARGLGIILVVVGHVERGLVGTGLAQGPVWAWLDYGLYIFHMPLFFLLAGVNVPASLAKGQGRFLHAKIWTIAYPYVLWSLVQGAILVAMSSVTNGHAEPADLLAIPWKPMSQFWFLYVLMACQLAALVLAPRSTLMAGLALVALAGATLLPQGGIIEEFLHAFGFFTLGILLSDRLLSWRPGGDGVRAVVAAIGLAAMVPLSGQHDGMNFDAALALPATACGILLLISLARLLDGSALRMAIGLGRMSMTIYVLHILAAAATRIVLVRLHMPPDPWLYLAICSAVGVAAPVAAHAVLDRLHLLPAFGLAPPRPGWASVPIRQF